MNENTMEHIDQTEFLELMKRIDFEALNEAILDLQAIVEPISRLFGR